MKKARFLILVFPIALILYSCKGKNEAPVVKPIEVPVVKVMQQDVALESEYAGQTYGESDVEIRARVEGWVTGMKFREGSMVTKGQVLYTIDDLPYRNNVDKASAALAEAQTALIKAENDLGRIEPLAKIGAVSQRELVAAQASFSSSRAMVESSEAALRNSKIELGYCNVTAPISGIIGISKVKIGDFVSRGPGMIINTVSNVDMVRVRFTLSEKEYLRISRLLKENNVKLGENKGNVRMILSDGTNYPERGSINFGDRQVDPSTGAMTFEATFNNDGNLIRPGQYVKLRLVTEYRKGALLIPQRSVNEMQGMFQVFTVADSNKLAIKLIKVGPAYNMSYVIEGGLKKDDRIVVGGTQLLRNGSIIKPDEKSWSPDSTNLSKITN
ncbi:MAG: efflux RND transporter periplasmic adaptor subunit [Bacteroidales bacterium]|jgi:membrane fusion protein (multidrug efflux system)|nr:efflux RND transporter periplasmic adaptor subunit [Bacteroidales bacterium]